MRRAVLMSGDSLENAESANAHETQSSSALPARPPAAPVAQAGSESAGLLELIDKLAERADPLVKLVGAAADRYQKGKERESRLQLHMAWVAVLVVFLIVSVSTVLTYLGKIDGSTFTFLLGLIVGYVLTFIRDSVRTPES